MSIIPSPTLLRHRAPAPGPERPRGVQPARLGGRAGVSADVLRDLNAAAKLEEHRARETRRPLPFPGLMAACGATHAACVLADTIIDDLSDLAENVVDLLPSLKSAYADHFTHLMLLPAVARLVELFGTEETGTEVSR